MIWLGNDFAVYFPIGRILRYKNDLFYFQREILLAKPAHTYISSLSYPSHTRNMTPCLNFCSGIVVVRLGEDINDFMMKLTDSTSPFLSSLSSSHWPQPNPSHALSETGTKHKLQQHICKMHMHMLNPPILPNCKMLA